MLAVLVNFVVEGVGGKGGGGLLWGRTAQPVKITRLNDLELRNRSKLYFYFGGDCSDLEMKLVNLLPFGMLRTVSIDLTTPLLSFLISGGW